MRRVLLVLAVAALMAAMVVLAAPAMAIGIDANAERDEQVCILVDECADADVQADVRASDLEDGEDIDADVDANIGNTLLGG